MKRSHAYKKLFKIIFLVILSLALPFFSYAQTAIDIQNKINQNNSNIQSLEQEIATYQSQLDSLGQQKASLNSSLKELDLSKKQLNANISLTQNKIDETNFTISNLSSSINDKESSITNDVNSIVDEIRIVDEFEDNSIAEDILAGKDFTSAWNDVDNINTVREKIRQNIVDLKQVKSDLEDTKQQTVNAKNQLVVLQSQLRDQQRIVTQNINDKNLLLKQISRV